MYTRYAPKIYHNEIMMKPKVDIIRFSFGWFTIFLTFSLKEMVLRIVTNKSIFNRDNILLIPVNPYLIHQNISTMEMSIQEHGSRILNVMIQHYPITFWCHFAILLMVLSVDKYGKLTVEAVLTCCLWFNRKARNRSST